MNNVIIILSIVCPVLTIAVAGLFVLAVSLREERMLSRTSERVW